MRTASCILLLLLAACDAEAPFIPPENPPSDDALLAGRSYTAKVPAGYDAAKAWPLLVALHGFGGSGAEVSQYFGLDAAAAADGLFLVAPDGILHQWNAGHARWPEWDQPWLAAVIHDLKARYHIDATRVIVFGFSQGAHLAHRMGCDASDDVTAVISVAGQAPTAPGDCAPRRPVTVLQIHGTADETIGYDGDVQHQPPDPTIPSAHDTVAMWAQRDGCSGTLAAAPGGPLDLSTLIDGAETSPERYAGCPAGADVALWTMRGVPHRPEPTPTFTAQALAFALAHPRVQ